MEFNQGDDIFIMKKTKLYNIHKKLNAKIIEFAGF